ncbi:PTS sugar transporter subunit IIA [Sphingomonas sp. RS6]
MTDLSELLVPEAVLAGVAAGNKKALFQQLGLAAAQVYGLDARDVTERLSARERLGSTGFGGGIAIPHARIDQLPCVQGLFLRLAQPIDFGAIDDSPVDLAFMLLSPSGGSAEHLKALASISRLLRDRAFAEKLRGAGSPDALYALLMGVEARDAA